MKIQTRALNLVNGWIGHRAVPRAVLLHKQSFQEENLPPPNINQPKFNLPLVVYYPRSYVEKVTSMNHEKKHDYNFSGVLFRDCVYENRKWIVDFAQQNFTDNSYYSISDAKLDYNPIGNFDYTLKDLGKRFIPSKSSNKVYFDKKYFQIICNSQFTLCPSGDAPWSMRFFESILCKSIPVLETPCHAWRSRFEKSIGYKFYTLSDDLQYREDWVEENYYKFLALPGQLCSRGRKMPAN